jgi:hypothetical protein
MGPTGTDNNIAPTWSHWKTMTRVGRMSAIPPIIIPTRRRCLYGQRSAQKSNARARKSTAFLLRIVEFILLLSVLLNSFSLVAHESEWRFSSGGSSCSGATSASSDRGFGICTRELLQHYLLQRQRSAFFVNAETEQDLKARLFQNYQSDSLPYVKKDANATNSSSNAKIIIGDKS